MDSRTKPYTAISLLSLYFLFLSGLSAASASTPVYWGVGLTKIAMKGVPGNPEFESPVFSVNIPNSPNLTFQGRLAIGGNDDDFFEFGHALGVYAKFHGAGKGVKPYLMLGYSSTRYTPSFFFGESESSNGLGLGFGVEMQAAKNLILGLELLALNRENDHTNSAITLNFLFQI